MALTYALVIDDCDTVREALVAIFASRELPAAGVASDREAREWIAQHGLPQVILLDLNLGTGSRGEEFLAWARDQHPDTPIIILTADVRVETCVRAMRDGAFYYLCKPFKMRELLRVVGEAARQHGAQRGGMHPRFPYMREDHFLRLAQSRAPLLIRGETGVGKEYLARALHRAHTQTDAPFWILTCRVQAGALQAEFIDPLQRMLAEAAQLGTGIATLLIDEPVDLPPEGQAALLRMLDESGAEAKGPLRWITAAQPDLDLAVERNKFRPDLYYRLSVLSLTVPPVRERKRDFNSLVNDLVRGLCAMQSRFPVPQLSPRAWDILGSHPFPGNVRQLKNVLEAALMTNPGPLIDSPDLPLPGRQDLRPRRASTDNAERERLRELIAKHRGSNKRVAEEMGVDPATVWRMKKRFGLIEEGT